MRKEIGSEHRVRPRKAAWGRGSSVQTLQPNPHLNPTLTPSAPLPLHPPLPEPEPEPEPSPNPNPSQVAALSFFPRAVLPNHVTWMSMVTTPLTLTLPTLTLTLTASPG